MITRIKIEEWLGRMIRRPVPVPSAPKECIIIIEPHKNEEKDGDSE